MYQEYTIGVLITLLSSVVAIVGLGIVSRIFKTKRLTFLFVSVLLLNIIWFSSLIFNYFKPFFPGPTDPKEIYWFEFLILSLIYVIRFGLLIALLSLIQHILSRSVSRKIISIARNSVIILSVMWLVSWIEIPLLGSRNVVDQLMVFTDFLLFAVVITAAVYLRYCAAYLPNVEYKKAIIFLSTIIIFPMAVGIIKLVIGSSLGKITFILERAMIYLTLMSFNILTAWWGIKYASLLSKYEDFSLSIKDLDYDDLERKYKITKREMEVIDLICMGKTNKEIAYQLFISVETVKDHNYKIFQKTGVKNRIQLVNLVNNLQKKFGN
jgi:DNA-binding CsgD family transcriptional regulator